MIYKVGLLGASGRMGLEIAALLAPGCGVGETRLELGDAVSGSKRLRSVEGVPVRTLSEAAWQPLHVWIDFSRPAGTMALLSDCDRPVVIGTTGFSDAEKERVKGYAERHPVVLASNTSPGMNLMQRMVRQTGGGFTETFQAILNETHHREKKDAPSGTAKTLLALLEEIGYSDVQVQVGRAGGDKGTHIIKLVGMEEEITIEHRVWDRAVFAKGALQAAAFLTRERAPRLYTMDDVFSERAV